MSTQLAEGLLAVLWLDRCRQVQRLTQGRTKEFREEVVRELLTAFIAEQRWGFAAPVADDEGVHVEGVLNFEATKGPGDHLKDHFPEVLILGRITEDIQIGQWKNIEDYMKGAEFFGGFPPGSLRRLPPGAPSR